MGANTLFAEGRSKMGVETETKLQIIIGMHLRFLSKDFDIFAIFIHSYYGED